MGVEPLREQCFDGCPDGIVSDVTERKRRSRPPAQTVIPADSPNQFGGSRLSEVLILSLDPPTDDLVG
jgi:hypothetical protein